MAAALLQLGQLAACSSKGNNTGADAKASIDAAPTTDADIFSGDAGLLPPPQGFQIATPYVSVAPGEEVVYCYYFHMPNTSDVGVKEWDSQMSPGSHHLILYTSSTDEMPVGTMQKDCNGGGISDTWTYSSQSLTNSAAMPPSVGMTVPAGQPAFVQMHYINTTESTLMAHVVINGQTYDTGVNYTEAAAFITYAYNISIPAHSPGSAGGSCSTPAGAKFFAMSTHSHKDSIDTQVTDGSTMVFSSTNWADPGVTHWSEPNFYTFASGTLNFHCDYMNNTDATIVQGPSAQVNEMCMAVGYFFPATMPVFCLTQ